MIAEVAAAAGEDNLFYIPFKQMPAMIPIGKQARLRAQAR
ncbi:hypothetical protein AF72_06185 [Xylella taiwanensis]|uniref:Uncharacterized protein n=1 Tax=Xylella taiwanensis TaxID=1444770 RepID=Z9JJG8_9GAMM|nr:hypothetical protein AF72_06185 [Xylella taiwanensis]